MWLRELLVEEDGPDYKAIAGEASKMFATEFFDEKNRLDVVEDYMVTTLISGGLFISIEWKKDSISGMIDTDDEDMQKLLQKKLEKKRVKAAKIIADLFWKVMYDNDLDKILVFLHDSHRSKTFTSTQFRAEDVPLVNFHAKIRRR